jgi:hypothetical protein
MRELDVNMQHAVVVDGDGHVMEPDDLWLRYLEPQWRDRAIRIARDAQGIENLLIDGRGHRLLRGKLGTLGGIGMQDDLDALFTPGARSYRDGLVPGGYDLAARFEVLDAEGIDIVLLYPPGSPATPAAIAIRSSMASSFRRTADRPASCRAAE